MGVSLSGSTDPIIWLEFVNTKVVDQGKPVDALPDPAALWHWLAERGVILEEPASARTARAHRAALEFRAALRAQADRMAGGKGPSKAGASAVNALLAEAPVVFRVEKGKEGYRSTRSVLGERPGVFLYPVADSFRRFLEEGDPGLVGRCDNPACIRFFYDTTKNRSRRWCSMETCGNRAKAAAYYRRRRRGRS